MSCRSRASRTLRGGALAAAAAALATCVVAAPAQAGTWSAPERLFSGDPVNPVLAGNDAGDAVATWTKASPYAGWPGDDVTYVALRIGGGRFGKPQRLAVPSGSVKPFGTAIDRNGNAFVGLLQRRAPNGSDPCCGIRIAIAPRGGKLGRPITLSVPGEGEPQAPSLAVARNGNAIAVWTADGLVEASVGDAHGFSRARVLGPATQMYGWSLPVGMTSRGLPFLLDVHPRPHDRVLRVREGLRAGGFGPPRVLARARGYRYPDAGFNALAAADTGRIAAWLGPAFRPAGFCCESWARVRVVTWERGGRHPVAQTLGTVYWEDVPVLAARPGGRALLLWQKHAYGIGVAERRPGEPFERQPDIPDARGPTAALNGHGAAVIAWSPHTYPETNTRIAFRSPAGQLGPPHVLRGFLPYSRTDYYYAPAARLVTIDDSGRAAVLLMGYGGHGLSVVRYVP